MTDKKALKQAILELKAKRGALENENVELHNKIVAATHRKENVELTIKHLEMAIFSVEVLLSEKAAT